MSTQPKPKLPSVKKAILRGLQKLKLRDTESPVVAVETSASPTYKLPKDFDEEDFAGLELLLLLESQNNPIRVLSFWRGKVRRDRAFKRPLA
jgi:hypothetical protein